MGFVFSIVVFFVDYYCAGVSNKHCLSFFSFRKFDEALEYHQQARILEPQSPSTYSAIGYVYALKGDNATAVDYFHKVIQFHKHAFFNTE